MDWCRGGSRKKLLKGERLLYFRIVREVGGMSVEEMLRRFSSSEITEWAALFKLEAKEAKKRQKGGR